MTVTHLARSQQAAAPARRRITILGATGSIGASTVDLIKRAPERYGVVAVTARRSADALAQIARSVGAQMAVVADPAAYGELKQALSGSGIEAAAGEEALLEAAQRPADWVMAAISGAIGLKPTMAAIERGATVALANKECLVCAGSLFMRRAASTGATVLPVELGAQRRLPGARRRSARGRQAGDPHGVRRPVPHLVARSNQAGDARAGAAPSQLVDGAAHHDRTRPP